MKSVEELFKGIKFKAIGVKRNFRFRRLVSDSRAVKKGDLFIAIKGSAYDGHDFIEEAIKNGAAAVCLNRTFKSTRKPPFIMVKNTTNAMPVLASRFFGNPARSLKIIGITGTNGKTTTAHLIYNILKNAEKSPSLLGTVGYKIGDEAVTAHNTTPGPLLLHSLLNQMKSRGTDYVVMEVSSHALKQARVSGIDFSLAALTNITGDHLDYHGHMDDYVRSKRMLFKSLGKKSTAVLNSDDRFCGEFKRATKGRVIRYGIKKISDFKAVQIEMDMSGSQFIMHTPDGAVDIRTPLVGRHNIYNIMAASAAAFAEGIGMEAIRETIKHFSLVPGRLESVEAGQDFKIFVDYAHTHDALENVLTTIRDISSGRIVVLFGCGGNRDKTKRSKMGRIASRLADRVILTSDNPRNENPDAILDEIEKGFQRGFTSYEKIPDRYTAIEETLKKSGASDIVIIAGKGHEDYQLVGDRTVPFNDKKVIEKILNTSKSYAERK